MAKISRLALFWRAFFISLIFGNAAHSASDEEVRAWNQAKNSNDASAFFNYISRFPTGAFIQDAVEALSDMAAIGTRSIPQAGPTFSGGEGDGGSQAQGLY